ncbi:hypothetical protein AB0N14_14830 [Streptomyces sp. NPDC051104]|uniref:hypothetical protein n=1 Tax=Streptomyces sp. NPDC051104 TaxID=3155044 RepID=UPI00341ECFAB
MTWADQDFADSFMDRFLGRSAIALRRTLEVMSEDLGKQGSEVRRDIPRHPISDTLSAPRGELGQGAPQADHEESDDDDRGAGEADRRGERAAGTF